MIHFLDEGMKVIKVDSLWGICEIKPKKNKGRM